MAGGKIRNDPQGGGGRRRLFAGLAIVACLFCWREGMIAGAADLCTGQRRLDGCAARLRRESIDAGDAAHHLHRQIRKLAEQDHVAKGEDAVRFGELGRCSIAVARFAVIPHGARGRLHGILSGAQHSRRTCVLCKNRVSGPRADARGIDGPRLAIAPGHKRTALNPEEDRALGAAQCLRGFSGGHGFGPCRIRCHVRRP